MKRIVRKLMVSLLISISILVIFTYKDLKSINLPQLAFDQSNGKSIHKPQLLDRNLRSITITYKNHWNIHNLVPLYEIPEFLQQAFIISEDKRFYDHNGIDWIARFHALWQNLAALKNVRGASTISEQTVKMIHPRPRTIWTRWLEGFEAMQLESRYSKNDILEFYLNQVPYSAQRRGVLQAAEYYFHRDLDTLNQQEMMTLAVIVRAPSRLNPIRHATATKPAIERLAKNMQIDLNIEASNLNSKVNRVTNLSTIKASHFAKYVYDHSGNNHRKIHTSLDLNLQSFTQKVLEQRIKDLKQNKVKNGAVLIVDHYSNEVLSWVVAGDSDSDYPGAAIDAVLTPRQPGSTLKPLLYATALESGLTAATLIDDSPLRESVGVGQHSYNNFSHRFYGPISVRESLGNSLNIPAVKTLQKIGTENFLKKLHSLGINSLQQHPDIYGDGLALGNGEITLFELVQAYTTLARGGQFIPLRFSTDQQIIKPKQIYSDQATSLIASILSDPNARKREFGYGSLLRLPVQTAVKTGTSNDYRDAWSVGFNHRYTVGVWMGNMDREAMKKVTGSSGPTLVLRSVFAELNRYQQTRSLYLSPQLIKSEICKETGLPPTGATNHECSLINEWFIAGTLPKSDRNNISEKPLRIQQPSQNLQLAMDPRIPDQSETFLFSLNQEFKNNNNYQTIKWILDDQLLSESSASTYQWKLEKGQHQLRAELWSDKLYKQTDLVKFLVK